MLFNSYYFIFYFLPITLILYYIMGKNNTKNGKLIVIIVASNIFYAVYSLKYLLLLVGSIIFNWVVSRAILCCKNERKRKWFLLGGICTNILSIAYFKYWNFFIDNINLVFGFDLKTLSVILPLGISFFTFQQISYLVDSFKGETQDYTFLEYSAFVTFFPQLIAGPIVLHKEIIPQFKEKKTRNSFSISNGLYVFSIGLFKKVIIADTFARAVNYGWSCWDNLSSLELLLISLAYTFEIYFDFSGYCDMAIGIGKLFNIELPINFNSPYKAVSINDFWDRWHKTLTRFLTTYIYIPLGGSRKGVARTYINIFIVFCISGLWHGANWTFILWGILHGVSTIIYKMVKRKWDALNPVFCWICTFSFVNFTWIIFRSDSISQAFGIITKIMHMDSTYINEEFISSFNVFKEIDIIIEHIHPLLYYKWATPGFYAILFYLLAFTICLGTKNLYEEEFKPTIFKSISSAILMFWSVISLTGVSTFLYFNF